MSDAASTEQQALHLKEMAGTLNNARDALVPRNAIFPCSFKSFLSLRAAGVIPDVLDDFRPTCRLQVLYPENHKEVLMGNHFNVTDAQHAPVVTVTCPGVSEADLDQYTIVLTDPDAPSRDDPKWSEFCHWIGKMPPSGVLQAELPKEALEKHKALAVEKKVSNEAVECKWLSLANPCAMFLLLRVNVSVYVNQSI